MRSMTPLAPVAIWFILGCQANLPPPPASAMEMRECPHTWSFGGEDSRFSAIQPNQLSVPGRQTNVPEFNDCQRFLFSNPPSALRYGPRFAIFASFRLDSLAQNLSVLDSGPGGSPIFGLAAAEVFADGRYDTLGIGPGFSCLIVSRRGNLFEARMLWVGPVEVDCTGRIALDTLDAAKTKDLLVRPYQGVGYQDHDYPPVARWDWDETTKTQYIGIKCGAAWCEIGPKGFQTSPTYASLMGNTASLPAVVRRVYEIKGWYDEQYLARSPGPGMPPVPTPLLSTIIPTPNLGDLDLDDFAHHWIEVATVSLPATSADYKSKFNFDASPPTQTLNSMYMCWAKTSACPGVSSESACGDGKWWVRIHAALDNSRRVICTTRYQVEDLEIPGTVRWRWRPDDEGQWVRCPQGCCEVLG